MPGDSNSSPSPFAGLTGNGITPYAPKAPITFENGKWVQNGQAVGATAGATPPIGMPSGDGRFAQAMSYLGRLRGGSTVPATAPGMNLTNPPQNPGLAQALPGFLSSIMPNQNPSGAPAGGAPGQPQQPGQQPIISGLIKALGI